jgi:hypothetical protein
MVGILLGIPTELNTRRLWVIQQQLPDCRRVIGAPWGTISERFGDGLPEETISEPL